MRRARIYLVIVGALLLGMSFVLLRGTYKAGSAGHSSHVIDSSGLPPVESLSDVQVPVHNWTMSIGSRVYGFKQWADCDCNVYAGRWLVTLNLPAHSIGRSILLFVATVFGAGLISLSRINPSEF